MDDINPTELRLAEDDDVLFSIAHGLRYNGKKRVHHADDHIARIAAEHLLKQLKASGFVLMKKPDASAHSAHAGHYPAKD